MKYIKEVIDNLLTQHKPREIADTLEVTTSMVSAWKRKENDFCPRIAIAARIYRNYDEVVYPYAEEALKSYDS